MLKVELNKKNLNNYTNKLWLPLPKISNCFCCCSVLIVVSNKNTSLSAIFIGTVDNNIKMKFGFTVNERLPDTLVDVAV
ncbi:hypothetical protein [Lactiplantibacillus plantarum]|uniref:hypothetical protein n=1 Tax=Lactiplantibacillus plantarum TaxID=1590 RepID=UPI0015873967|nr:hypothetical protein [Lactiplantibacillus plantarum]